MEKLESVYNKILKKHNKNRKIKTLFSFLLGLAGFFIVVLLVIFILSWAGVFVVEFFNPSTIVN